MNELKKITREQRAELQKPLPACAIKQHPTKKFLSTINAIYVVERLNEVFGTGEWSIRHKEVAREGKMIVLKALFTVRGYDIRIEQYGGNDNPDLGDAYKGAATDALTKIGSYLEIGIDVWKDKKPEQLPNSDKSAPVKTDDAELPWMSEKDKDAVINRILKGQPDAFEKAKKVFRIKRAYREEIEGFIEKQPENAYEAHIANGQGKLI